MLCLYCFDSNMQFRRHQNQLVFIKAVSVVVMSKCHRDHRQCRTSRASRASSMLCAYVTKAARSPLYVLLKDYVSIVLRTSE